MLNWKWLGWIGVWCVCAAPATLLTACGDGGAKGGEQIRQEGTLTMALGGVGDRGNRYRVRAADFALDGASARTFSSDDFLGQDQARLELPVGAYTLTLSGAWFLERLTVTGYQRVANATLLSPDQVTFGVLADSTSTVAFAFQVGDEVVAPPTGTNGTLAVIATVHEAGGSALCGNGAIDPGETCDDANADPCDGCAACVVRDLPVAGPIEAPAVITQDTIWCAAESPVHLTSNVIVLQGATLFVGPGARVEADAGVQIQVRGAFRVNGDGDARAVFTSSAAAPEPGAWGGIDVTATPEGTLISQADFQFANTAVNASSCCPGTLIEHSSFSHNAVGVTNPARVVDSVFSDNRNGVVGFGGSEVEDSLFERNSNSAVQGASVVRRSRFVHNGLAGATTFVCGPSGCTLHGAAVQNASRIEDSVFLNNDAAIAGVSEIVDSEIVANNVAIGSANRAEHCLIADNLLGLQQIGESLLDSTLVRNGGAMAIFGSAQMHGNTLCNGAGFQVRNTSTSIVDVTENFWCTIDREAIAAQIHDLFDDSALGPLVFEPFLSAAPAAAPADPGPPSEPAPGSTVP